MKIQQKIFIVALITIALFTTSCKKYYNPGLNISEVKEDTVVSNEGALLREFILKSGNYINSLGIPNMIDAQDVYDNLNNYLVLDIRSHEEYVAGHINGAINVKQSEVMNFLDNKVSPSAYDKVVIACHTGQTASYVTSALRLAGYNNVYAMKYGMSSWNKELDKWTPNVSNKYANQLSTDSVPKAKSDDFPKISTGEKGAAEILRARVKEVLKTPFYSTKIKADEAFANPDNYYIINYWPMDKYLKGHIPGAHQYTPRKDLSVDGALNTLPTNKKILVYCFTGQNAAFTISYLRVLGYDAYTIPFGANAFMHDLLVQRQNWHGFKTAEKVNNFPLVKGENPSDKKLEAKTVNQGSATPKPKKKIIKRKKKEVTGGCG